MVHKSGSAEPVFIAVDHGTVTNIDIFQIGKMAFVKEADFIKHCLLLFGLILSLELVNTALEAVVDLVTKEKKPLAKIAKDTAAGAVLVSAIAAAIIGCIIFVPYLLELIKSKR